MKPTTELQKEVEAICGLLRTKPQYNAEAELMVLTQRVAENAMQKERENLEMELLSKAIAKGALKPDDIRAVFKLSSPLQEDTSGREIVCTIKQPVWDEQESKGEND